MIETAPTPQVKSIRELCDIVRGVSYKKDDARTSPAKGYVPVLRAMNIEADLNFDPLVWVPSKYVESAQMLRVGDIVVASSSGSRSVVGKGAALREPWHGAFGAFCAVLRPRGDDPADARYIAHFISSPDYRRLISSLAVGVNINNIRRTDLASMLVPWPDAAKRRTVVAMLDVQLARIDAAQVALTDAIARGRAYLASAYLTIVRPDSWPEVQLGDVADIQGGIQKQPSRRPQAHAYPYLRVANVLYGRLDLAEMHRIELFGNELGRLRLETGDLLIVEGNGSPSQIGRMAIWDGSIADCVHQNHIIRARLSGKLRSKFVLYYWNSRVGRTQIERVASSTSGLHTLSVRKVSRLRVPQPPLEVQDRLLTLLDQQETTVNAVLATIRSAQEHAHVLRRQLIRTAFPDDAGVSSEVRS